MPGVLYGKGHSRAIVVGERDLRTALTGASGLHAIVDVMIEGQKTPHHAVLKDYQQHPMRGTVTHVDFHEVRLDQPIQAPSIVRLVGEAPGAKLGGVVQQVTRELHVEALPAAIPEHIEADISGLEVGATLRLEDIPAIEGVTFLDDPPRRSSRTARSPAGSPSSRRPKRPRARRARRARQARPPRARRELRRGRARAQSDAE